MSLTVEHEKWYQQWSHVQFYLSSDCLLTSCLYFSFISEKILPHFGEDSIKTNKLEGIIVAKISNWYSILSVGSTEHNGLSLYIKPSLEPYKICHDKQKEH